MASKVLICDPCSRLNKSSNAMKFCTDCDDALCTDCTTVHSALKITISHNVVDATALIGRTFNLQKYCNDHQDMPLEFFCSDHDCLLCRSCMANTHRTCGKILPIDVAAKGIKSSVMFDDISKDIYALRKSAKELVEDRQKNKKRVQQTKKLTQQKITKFRNDINKHLDQLEKKLYSDVDTMERKLDEKASTDLSESKTTEKDIEDIWEQINFLNKHGSESQLLILLNAVRTKITKQSTNLQELILSHEMNGLDFEKVDLTSAINSIGLVKHTSSPCSVSYQLPKHVQAQIQQTHGNVPTKFEFEKKINIPSGRITCIAVTDDNRLLLCNDVHLKNNLMAYKETGTLVQTCTISSRIFGIAIIPHTEEAVVSLADVKIVQFVNIVSLMPGRQLRVIIEDSSMYGIAVVRDSIIVGGSSGNVYVIEKMKGKCLKTIKIGTGNISSLVPFVSAKDEVLFCCEYNGNKKVHSMKLDGTLISSCELGNAIGMTLDSKRNVYVASSDSDELYRLSSDWDVDDILLMKSDRLDKPMGVAFNRTYSKLYISNCGFDKSLLVFNCK
ncbi:uncharacterized protein LOC127738695 [Mytilus californianus]|uniref:uncharacterized protein LOC127738695 n=1 Tax=Mytilus californianus TaxID=6549 RepID=UPI002247C5B9|nr:uncharacterized protein LOC127738695 [Mytilus californianus]